jgi:hypothetical protein
MLIPLDITPEQFSQLRTGFGAVIRGVFGGRGWKLGHWAWRKPLIALTRYRNPLNCSIRRISPFSPKALKLNISIQNTRAAFPVHVLDAVISHLKWVGRRYFVDDFLGLPDVAHCYLNPNVLESVGDLAKHVHNVL